MKVFFLGFVLLASMCFAQTSGADPLPPQPLPGASAPPEPIDGSVLRFSQLLPLWQNGTATNEALLAGTWISIARATNIACNGLEQDSYDLNGIKNSDGSILTLKFDYQKVAAIPGGTTPDKIFGVWLLNLGSKSVAQGPYRVDPNEPQFSRWTYSGRATNDAYLANSCRAVAGEVSEIVCTMQLYILGSDSNPVNLACAASGVGAIEVYKKQ